MKNLVTHLLFLGGFITYLFLLGNSGGAIAGVTGAPEEETCARSGCHSGTVNSGSATVSLKFGEDATAYTFDETYAVSISIDGAQNANKNGFEIVALDEQNNNIGEWILAGDDLRSRTGSDREYVTQTSSGSSKSAWSIDWKAPSIDAGNVTFYLAYNDSNGNGGTSGDNVYTTTLSVGADGVSSTADLVSIENINAYPNPFTEILTVQLSLIEETHLTATLVNTLGQNVNQLFSKKLAAGTNTLQLNIPRDLSNGLYFLQISNKTGDLKSIPVMKQ